MITVTKERHPQVQDEKVQSRQPATVTNPTYASATGLTLLELRASPQASQMWRSEDNGRSWALADQIPPPERLADGTYAKRAYGPLLLDPDCNRLIRFQGETRFRSDPAAIRSYQEHKDAFIPDSFRWFYQVSRDGGRSWDKLRQFIEAGREFNETHWARDVVWLESSAVLGEPPPFHKLPDGRLVIPCQVRTAAEVKTYGTIQAGRFYGRWRDDGDIAWSSGGRVYGGGCEQTTAILNDGRILNILRAQGQIQPYPLNLWLRPYSLSDDNDGGQNWSAPKPLSYDDGSGLTSPRAWSQLIRSTKNGRLYWIANILPALEQSGELRAKYPYRADPRHPLQIVEVDEATVTLKRRTLTVIEDRQPGETHWVRFSNFFAYNDRQTGDIVLLMQKSYCELQENLEQQPHPSLRYRISVPAG